MILEIFFVHKNFFQYFSYVFSIELCKQVANSLRVIFDFTLKPRLLYDVERDYFDRISESYELKESPPSDGPDIK